MIRGQRGEVIGAGWRVPGGEEFDKRIIGTMFVPYIKGDEVWGVAKIYNDSAIKMMGNETLSNSPAVVFRDPKVNSKMELEDGSTLLIEGKPSLLDHLAICEHGVWDKGGEPNGIRADSTGVSEMAEEHIKENEDKVADKKADADGEKLDKVLAHLDSVAKMCDSLSSRMDAYEEKEKADAEEDESEKKDEDLDDNKPEPVAADSKKKADRARKDAEEEEMADKAKKDAEEEMAKAKADSAEMRKKIADLEARIPKQMSDDDFAKMADAQARADSVANAFGKRAPRPLDGENLDRYRRRLATGFKEHSPAWGKIDLNKINDAGAFEIAENQIYADAMSAARNPIDIEEGVLRPITSRDPQTDRLTTTFVGRNTFIKAMKSPVRMVAGINTRSNAA